MPFKGDDEANVHTENELYSTHLAPGWLPTLEGLIHITDRRPLGPFPTFDRAHLLLAFVTIGQKGSVGRHALASSAGLGEGAIRTVIKRLREEGLATVGPSGCQLTPSGKRVYSALAGRLSPAIEVRSSDLTMGAHQVGVAVRKGGTKVTSGIEQRDSAIKVGAAGATTYIIREDRFTIPGGSSDCEHDYPSVAWAVLRRGLEPRENDAVILCGAALPILANLGAVAAATTLL
jgi:Domain of unknown function (DUF4443)/CggR N-terminal DNA binding domain